MTTTRSAMRWLGPALTTLALLAACGGDSTSPTPQAAAVTVLSGNGQQAATGAPLPNPLVVRVSDADGDPLRGVTVQWSVATGGGSLATPQSTTDAAGLAQVQWTLGAAPGVQTVTAAVEGVSQAATFTATAVGAPPAAVLTLQKVSGDGQTATAGTELPQPLVVEFRRNDQPVAGVEISWTPSGGTANPITSVTDVLGRASTRWQLSPAAGSATMQASTPGTNPVFFTVAVVGGSVRRLEVLDPQVPPTPFGGTADTARVRVLDALGNPLAGVAVQWQVLLGGGSVAPSSVSGADGVAVAPWALSDTARDQVVRAASAGLSPVTLTRFVRRPYGAAVSAVKVSGDGQSAPLRHFAADSLKVQVRDAQGRGVPGVEVRWRIDNSSETSTQTDELGNDYFPAYGSDVLGQHVFHARVVPLGAALDFTVTTVLGPPGRLLASASALRYTGIPELQGLGWVAYNADGTLYRTGTSDPSSSSAGLRFLDQTGAVVIVVGQPGSSNDRTRYLVSAAEGTDRVEISALGPSGARLADTVPAIVRQVPTRVLLFSSLGLQVGQQGNAVLLDTHDGRIASATWTSSDPSVMSVASGVYTAVSPGVAIIRAEKDGVAFRFGVYVYP